MRKAGQGKQVRQARLDRQVRWYGLHGLLKLVGSVKKVKLDEQVRWAWASGQVKQDCLSWATDGDPERKKKKNQDWTISWRTGATTLGQMGTRC